MFRSWGRIGTTIGNDKLEQVEDLNDAVGQFEALYEEKTGNRFTAKEFKKVPGCWYPLDIDYGQVSNGNMCRFVTAVEYYLSSAFIMGNKQMSSCFLYVIRDCY